MTFGQSVIDEQVMENDEEEAASNLNKIEEEPKQAKNKRRSKSAKPKTTKKEKTKNPRKSKSVKKEKTVVFESEKDQDEVVSSEKKPKKKAKTVKVK